MMMAQQPFPAPQGIPQHPGLPPHPMGPGHHPNAAPPGGGMVQQMHPGVSAPGGPHVSQAGPMLGMPPGAGTTGPGGPMANAHALSHLGPAQAHLFQQPQFAQTFANNPQLLQQHQQQQFLKQRMMFQQQAAQQHGIPVSLPNGGQGLNAAQIAMQANPGMRPMMHLQQMPHGQAQSIQQQHQQQQQLFAMQQAQAQAQQAQQAHQAQQVQPVPQVQPVQQPNAAGQPGQHTPQRAAVQSQNAHEAHSVTPQPQPGPPPQGGNTPQQQSNQLQQPPSSQPQQQQVGTPQPHLTPNLQQPHLPQAPQAAQQQQQQQQHQHQHQHQHQQPQSQPQQPQLLQGQSQPQSQQPQHQGQQQNQQHQQQMSAQEAQMRAQQHQNPAALMMQQRMAMKGASILCLNAYAEHLGNFISRGEAEDLSYWNSFVEKFYSPNGVLRQGVYNHQSGSKQFEISTPALARYYLTQFTSGIRRIQMIVEGARERDSLNGGHIVESGRTSFVYWFTNNCHLFSKGSLRAYFDTSNKIEMLDVVVMEHNEYIPRNMLQAAESPDQKQSPKVVKGTGKRAQQKLQQNPPSISVPESMVTADGVPTAVMGFLEVTETISQMQMLFQYSQQHPQLSPPEALRHLVNALQTQGPNVGFVPSPMNQAMQMQNQMPRGPNMNGPPQFGSPAVAHLGLPGVQGSPHIGGSAHASPAPGHLAAPIMVQQNPSNMTGTQGANPVTSPHVTTNKRRRASTIKMEGDEGNGNAEMNGAAAPKVKASPRTGGKRQKGTA